MINEKKAKYDEGINYKLLTVELILYNIIKYFKQEKYEMMICRTSIQEPWSAESLQNKMTSVRTGGWDNYR
jgi:hypothetical protein